MHILLITNTFPYGGEYFLKTELDITKSKTNVWTLFPSKRVHNELLTNHRVCLKKFEHGYTFALQALFASIIDIIFTEKYDRLSILTIVYNIIKLIKFTYTSEIKYLELKSWISLNWAKEKQFYIYSYWMYESAFIGAKLKMQFPNCKFVTRCHGYDLYAERHRNGYLPYRRFILDTADLVCPISVNGRNYLNKIYDNEYAKKIQVCRLGTIKLFDDNNDKQNTSDEILIVSCSSLSAVKRVHLIAEALRIFSEKIRWVHFGDGTLRSEVEKMCIGLPSNVSVELKGQVSNEEIQKFYSQFRIHAFINVSESEGIPVSIMEAISYGIPVVATNVGGTSEIVFHNENGVLLDKNFAGIVLCDAIVKVKHNWDKYSENARRIWSEKYDANKNYDNFYSLIEGLEDLE